MQLKDNTTALRNLSALVDFSNLINSSLDIKFALNNLLLTCFGKFHTTKGLVALINEKKEVEVKVAKGITQNVLEVFPKISIDEYSKCDELNKFLEDNKLPICQEIIATEGIKGLLVLGEKLTKKPYDNEDKDFLKTIVNIGATAIENSLTVDRLKKVNRDLDSKVNQLSSLFDLSKEFSGILEENMVGKLLVFSIIGQLMVSKYAVIICEPGEYRILETKIRGEGLNKVLKDYDFSEIKETLTSEVLHKDYIQITEIGIELIIPMQIKGQTKGVILLGKRISQQSYSQSDIEFISSVGSLAIISIENGRLFKEALEKQRLEKDLELARNIQKNLLPDSIPNMLNYEMSAFNKSAKQVGGDYYDVVKLDETHILFAIGDVSGKGVQAALLMANLQAFLQSISKQNIHLNEASNLINDLVSENTIMGSFITFFWGILDDSTKDLIYVNAGHNPPLLVRNGEIQKLKKGGMILGVMQTMIPYESESISLQKDDTIILFTDGITEAMNPEEEEYSDEKLEEFVLNLKNQTSNEIIENIKTEIFNFTAGAEQSDDITCLVIKVK